MDAFALEHCRLLRTARVIDGARREVVLRSVEDLRAEIDRIDGAARLEMSGGATPGGAVGDRMWVSGNWSAGQTFQHLARAVEWSLGGSISVKPAARTAGLIDWAHDAPELAPDIVVWTDVGADCLRRALDKIELAQWVELHLRHAEEHLARVHVR